MGAARIGPHEAVQGGNEKAAHTRRFVI